MIRPGRGVDACFGYASEAVAHAADRDEASKERRRRRREGGAVRAMSRMRANLVPRIVARLRVTRERRVTAGRDYGAMAANQASAIA